MKPLSIGVALFAMVLVAGDARAEAVEPVRVYTNADIERLAPLPTQDPPLVEFDRERWEFVIQFLEREHARLNADRNHDLARELLRANIAAAPEHPRYGLALSPYADFYWRPHRAHHVRPAPSDSFSTPAGGFIVPLHARPSHARLHFDRAARRAAN